MRWELVGLMLLWVGKMAGMEETKQNSLQRSLVCKTIQIRSAT